MNMIKSIETNYYEEVIMETGDIYRRYCGGHWEKLYGETWEPCYSEEKELESQYKNFVTKSWNFILNSLNKGKNNET